MVPETVAGAIREVEGEGPEPPRVVVAFLLPTLAAAAGGWAILATVSWLLSALLAPPVLP